MKPAVIYEKRYQGPPEVMQPHTIRLLAKVIREGSHYGPIILEARSLATLAPARDELGQAREIYNNLTKKKWKFVKDPIGLETVVETPRALHQLIMGHNGGVGRGLGAGDCTNVAAAMGSQLMAIGIPVRIVTTRNPGYRGPFFNHVFVQGKVAGHGWITFDPVGYPHRPMGAIAPNTKIGYWNIDGKFVGLGDVGS